MSDKHAATVAAIAIETAAAAEAAADQVFSDVTGWLADVRKEWPGAMFLCVAIQRIPVTEELVEKIGASRGPNDRAINTRVCITPMARHEVFAGTGGLLLHAGNAIAEQRCACPGCQKALQVAQTAAHFLMTHGTEGVD